jgi:release factor glutamine methyltransferase
MTVLPTAGALAAEGVEALRAVASPLDAQLLLAHVLGISRTHLSAHPEAPVGTAAAAQYRRLLARRAAGEPLAYLTGTREFWSLPLSVTPAVLVPRPETELLVERALELGPPLARVADLGTGSGAIALALASERPGWQVTATDMSAAALEIARANAAALGLQRIALRQGDWYLALAGESFDLILSNPPYVAADDPAMLALAHEPRGALTPGADALASLRILAHGAPQHLRPGGWLVLEHGAAQGAQVRAELVLAGLRHVRSHPDLAGHERITEGQR